jgi:hypothetical protein
LFAALHRLGNTVNEDLEGFDSDYRAEEETVEDRRWSERQSGCRAVTAEGALDGRPRSALPATGADD